MIKALGVIAAYVGAMWWLFDRGRTPVLAILCSKLSTLLGSMALSLGQAAWDLDRTAYTLIRRRSLA